MTDIAFEILEDGTPLKITDGNQIKIYGDLYGNGHLLSAERDQVEGVNGMLRIAWSHVTVSNIGIRANRMDKDGTLSTDETSGLQGECVRMTSGKTALSAYVSSSVSLKMREGRDSFITAIACLTVLLYAISIQPHSIIPRVCTFTRRRASL